MSCELRWGARRAFFAVREALSTYGRSTCRRSGSCTHAELLVVFNGGEDRGFRAKLAEKGVIIAGSLAHLAGKAFRIRHIGNTMPAMLEEAVKLIGESLNELGKVVDIEKAIFRLKEEWAVTTK